MTQVTIIGAGYSGICAAIQLKKHLGLEKVTILEKNADVGGVWFSNKYPGCALDSPWHIYTYSFEMDPLSEKNYMDSEEIQNYFRNVAIKYGIYKDIQFNTEVESLHWDESLGKWRVTIISSKKRRMFYSDIIVNATGIFRVPHRPKEFENFQGPIMHSAEWDSSVDLENKNIGIVGSGSSAIQLIPALSSVAKSLHCFQRDPSWVLPIRPQFTYPNWMRKLFQKIPLTLWLFRWLIFWTFEILLHNLIIFNSRTYRFFQNMVMSRIQNGIKDETLKNQVTPSHQLLCKVIAASNDYYNALEKPNVFFHNGSIAKTNKNSLTTENGQECKLDVLVLATGFDVQEYFGQMEIFGLNGENVLSTWKERAPKGYLGTMCSTMPNLFTLLGPYGYAFTVPPVLILEWQTHFMITTLREMIGRNCNSVRINPSVEDEYDRHMRKELLKKENAWNHSSCSNSKTFFKNESGEIILFANLSGTYLWRMTHKKDFSIFEFS